MSNHQAPEQMVGYLYQVRYALALLLDNDNPDFQISIEKFDDIAFSKDDTPKQLIQLKHHVRRHGNLTDSSTDLWRTLKVWLDEISKDRSLLEGTNFLIITTATAPIDSAAFCLKRQNRDVDTAYKKLKAVCEKSENQSHQSYYATFLATAEDVLKELLSSVYIVDNASNIIDVEKVFRKQIRYSCTPRYEDQICERLEGWWYKKTVEALCSENPVFVSQNQVRSFIVSISQEYTDENLPIDVWDIDTLQENDLGPDERIFYEQLKLICLSSRHMKSALRDYYRAFKQRANWVRNDLLYVNELEKYEQRLLDEWEHSFAAMEDNLSEYGITVPEDEKIKQGRNLLKEIENKDIRIRKKCQEAFVMRGSYHILANQLKVGWHVDFYSRLKKLLAM